MNISDIYRYEPSKDAYSPQYDEGEEEWKLSKPSVPFIPPTVGNTKEEN